MRACRAAACRGLWPISLYLELEKGAQQLLEQASPVARRIWLNRSAHVSRDSQRSMPSEFSFALDRVCRIGQARYSALAGVGKRITVSPPPGNRHITLM